MSADDRSRWDARYRERAEATAEVAAPSALVTSLADLLPTTGRALDVAGGAGRHAIWLARRGLDVTLVDVSEVGLELSLRAAAGAGVAITTCAVDLEQEPFPPGPWDLILCFHYLQRSLFGSYAASLAPGGWLVVVHPTQRNLERHASPSTRFLLAEGELPSLAANLAAVRYHEGWLEEGRHEALLVARRGRSGTDP